MSTDLDSTPESGTMATGPGEATMAIDSQPTSTTEPDAAPARHEHDPVRAFVVISAVVLAVLLIVAAVVHVAGDKPATAPIAQGPSEATIEAQDKAAALKTLQAYSAAVDKAYAQRRIAGTGLDKVTDDNLLQHTQAFIDNMRAGGFTYRGKGGVEATVTKWTRDSVFERLVTLDACVDWSRSQMRDAKGRVMQNTNPDGTPDKRVRAPFTYSVQATGARTGPTVYKVYSETRDPNNAATC